MTNLETCIRNRLAAEERNDRSVYFALFVCLFAFQKVTKKGRKVRLSQSL